jgi:hypothetical protein
LRLPRKKPSKSMSAAQRAHALRICTPTSLTAYFSLLASRPQKATGCAGGAPMVFVRRLLLVVFVLVVPVALTAAIYVASVTLLHLTNRTIEPVVLHYSAAVEYAVFLLLACLEVKNRW